MSPSLLLLCQCVRSLERLWSILGLKGLVWALVAAASIASANFCFLGLFFALFNFVCTDSLPRRFFLRILGAWGLWQVGGGAACDPGNLLVWSSTDQRGFSHILL